MKCVYFNLKLTILTLPRILSGGYFISPHFEDNRRMSIDNSIYITISRDNHLNYLNVYQRISNLDCQALYFIEWDSSTSYEQWGEFDCMGIGVPIKIPSYRVFEYRDEEFLEVNIDRFLEHYPQVHVERKYRGQHRIRLILYGK